MLSGGLLVIQAGADRVPPVRARLWTARTGSRPARTGIRTGRIMPWSADRDPRRRRMARIACREAAW